LLNVCVALQLTAKTFPPIVALSANDPSIV
jgi:hypothetical protein